MKKIIKIIVLILVLTPLNVNAEQLKVALNSCVDGDTAKFKLNKKNITAIFLAIDTPETKHPKKGAEAYGKKASGYTCDQLRSSKNIYIEYDDNSDMLDKYNRHLVWVFVDKELLQEKIIKKGLGKVDYVYGEYKYLNKLKKAEQSAKKSKLGIWSDEKTFTVKIGDIDLELTLTELIIFGIIILLLIIGRKFIKKLRNNPYTF